MNKNDRVGQKSKNCEAEREQEEYKKRFQTAPSASHSLIAAIPLFWGRLSVFALFSSLKVPVSAMRN